MIIWQVYIVVTDVLFVVVNIALRSMGKKELNYN